MAHDRLPDPARRAVLAGGGFALMFAVGGKAWALGLPRPQPEDPAAAALDGNPAFAPNAFIRIDRTGPVRLVMPNIEMGQGAYTGQATMMAEDLDIGLDQLSVEHAPPNAPLYAMALHMQATGGSATTRGGWQVFREAGAVARAMLVAAAAQQWGVDPSSCTTDRGMVHHADSGRSLAYGALAEAAAQQPVPPKVILKDPKDFKLIGKSWRRLDTAGKVDGSTPFGLDMRAPGMMIAVVAVCPVYGGKLMSVDDAATRILPGVKDVIRLDNAVAVTGVHFWAAKTGLEALDIQWDLGPNAAMSSAALAQAMDESSKTGTNAIVARQVGDLNKTGKTIEAIYQIPALAHAPMEPLNALVHVRPDACEIWVGTQVPTRVVDAAVKITGLPADKILVHQQYLGGGFGRRLEIDSIEQAVGIAKQAPYPVKLIWTREQDIRHDIPRPPYYDRISAVVDGDGYPLVWRDRVTSDSVGRRWAPVTLAKSGLDPDTVEGAAEPPYDLANLKVEWMRHDMPGGRPVGWWRGVGPTHNLFKVESFIDELAHAAGKDPLAYRRAILKNNPRALGVLNLAAEKIGWGQPLGDRIGRGIALGAPFGSFICAILETEVTPAGEIRMRRAVAAVDCGINVNPNTIEAQIQGGLVFGWTGALYSQLTYENGAIQQSNFHDYRMMRMNETPPIAVHIVQSAEHPGGIGEVGTAIAAPALGNAIFAATGVRIRQLPINRTLLVKDKAVDKTPLAVIAPLGLAAAALVADRALASASARGDGAEQ